MTLEPESAHRTHDVLLVAGHASGNLGPADAERVDGWLRECRECASLRDDLRALSVALSALPKAAPAPRDFRLTSEQAAHLRGGSWWRRLARSLVTPRGVGRPLATAFTTLGLVGLLVGSLPVASLTFDSATPERALVTTGASPNAAGNPVPGAMPSPTDDQFGAYSRPAEDAFDSGDERAAWPLRAQASGSGSGSTGSQTKDDTESAPPSNDLMVGGGSTGATEGADARDAAAPTVRPILPLAIAFLGIGLALFAVRRFGRRLS